MSASKKSQAVKQLSHTVVEPSSGADADLNPIIYLHTVGASKQLWPVAPQEIADATKRKSFVLDLRCHGDNEPSEEFSLQLLVEDLRQFMESQALKQAIIIGHGLGGRTACVFALQHPSLIEMLVNVDATLNEDIIRETDQSTLDYIGLWREGVTKAPKDLTPAEVVKRTYEYVYSKFSPAEGLEAQEHLNKYEHPIKKKEDGSFDVKHQMKPISDFLEKSVKGQERLQLEGRYEGRALFLMGDSSKAKNGIESEEIKKKFPKVEFVYVKNGGHKFHLKEPKEFVKEFLKFYNKKSQPEA